MCIVSSYLYYLISSAMTTLIFTRPYEMFLLAFKWYILIDGREAGSVKNNSATEIEVAPGTHTIELRCYDTSKLTRRRYIYSKPITISVADNETMPLEVAPHPLWNLSHKAKLFSKSESLILIPQDEQYAAVYAHYEQERKNVLRHLRGIKFHNVTIIMTLVTSLYLMLTNVLLSDQVEAGLSLPFLCGVFSIIALVTARNNKLIVQAGFEWQQQLAMGLFICYIALFGMVSPSFTALKNSYFIFGMAHIALSIVMYKRRPAMQM